MMRVLVMMTALLLVGCGEVTVNLPEEIGPDFDFDELLAEIKDCDRLSETFVSVVREAAEDIDELAEASGGRVQPGELAAKVDVIVQTRYFDLAERMGCNVVSQRVRTLERLRELSPQTQAGTDLVEDVIRDIDTGST